MKLIIENYFLNNLVDSHVEWIKSKHPEADVLKYKKGDLIPMNKHYRVNMGEQLYKNTKELYINTKKRFGKHNKVELIGDKVKMTEKAFKQMPIVQILYLV